MVRLQSASVGRGTILVGLLLNALVNGCSAHHTTPETAPRQREADLPDPGNAASRAKLQPCFHDAKAKNPNLSVHTVAWYFARGDKVVFVDTLLSSFFLELGDPPARPEVATRGLLQAQLARRDALVRRALELGLIQADDPLFERLKAPGVGALPTR